MGRKRSELDAVWAMARVSPRSFLRRAAKQPFVMAAERRMAALPQIELAELVALRSHEVRLADTNARHSWSLGAIEQSILQLIVADRSITAAFEIGTFNGGTTALLAEAMADDGEVITLDLPEAAFTATQGPRNFAASDVGALHRASSASHKVRQLREDSMTFDATPWSGWADLVLVDGAHDYPHGHRDTMTAFELVKDGGIVLWDDFQPYWHGLVHGILDACGDRPVARLAGTSFLVLTSA